MMGSCMVRDKKGLLSLLTKLVAAGNHSGAVVRSSGTWQHEIQGFLLAEKG